MHLPMRRQCCNPACTSDVRAERHLPCGLVVDQLPRPHDASDTRGRDTAVSDVPTSRDVLGQSMALGAMGEKQNRGIK